MNSLMFLAAGAGMLVIGAVGHNDKVHGFLDKHSKKMQYLPRMVTVLIISAQMSELIKVLEHATIVNVVTAIFLLALVMAVRPGTEGEWH